MNVPLPVMSDLWKDAGIVSREQTMADNDVNAGSKTNATPSMCKGSYSSERYMYLAGAAAVTVTALILSKRSA